jgi:hypothetical protein
MMAPRWAIVFAGLNLLLAVPASAQLMTVTVLDRQDKEDGYDYTAVYYNTAVGKHFTVHGATFTLQLPDGRLAVVNCDGKFAEHLAGPAGNRRSCRMPLVNTIQADFNSDRAKLIWPVSLDGKKLQSETYKILAIIDTPKGNGNSAAPQATAASAPARTPVAPLVQKSPPAADPPAMISVNAKPVTQTQSVSVVQQASSIQASPVVKDGPAPSALPPVIKTVAVRPAAQAQSPAAAAVQPRPATPETQMPNLSPTPELTQVQFAEAVASLARKWEQMPEYFRRNCTSAKTVPDLQRCVVQQQQDFLRLDPNASLASNPWLYALEAPVR